VDERQVRIGRNEAIFREVNERLQKLAKDFQITDELLGLLCECGNANCHEKIELTASEYEALRAEPTHFAVAPGHEEEDVESVVARTDRYLVVRKGSGPPAQLARDLDPRS